MDPEMMVRIAAVVVGLLLLVGGKLLQNVKMPTGFSLLGKPDDAKLVLEITRRRRELKDDKSVGFCKQLMESILNHGP